MPRRRLLTAGILLSFVSIGLGRTLHGQTVESGVAHRHHAGFPDPLARLRRRRSKESVGVEQKIQAEALALGSDEQHPAILLTVDSLGVPDSVVVEVAARLKLEAGIERDHFAVSSSHTHSAPMLIGIAPNIFGKPLPEDQHDHVARYTRQLIDKLEQVALSALKDRRPALLSWSRGKVGFAENRRTKGGPVDHDLPILRVSDPSGKVRAVVVGYACHCTTLDPADNVISADWAGYAREGIEKAFPGAIALTVIGCGGDANPAGRTTRGIVRKHGQSLADEAARVLKEEKLVPLTSPPVVQFRRVDLPLDDLPTRRQLEALVKAGGAAGGNAALQLAKLDRGESLQSKVDYPIQTWRFGDDLAIVFLAGEVVVDYSSRLKKELDPERLWVAAYSNDVPCYIPSERILREGGYEGGGAMVYYALPTKFRKGLEERIVSTVHQLLPTTFKAKPKPDQSKAKGDMPPPLSPEEGLRSLKIRPGLRVELVAAEPLVLDPVAIDFGADGKLWVCEMRDYPMGIDGNWKPGGRITSLEDTNGDGRYDKATNFIDGIPFPTGVMAWRKGVLVSPRRDSLRGRHRRRRQGRRSQSPLYRLRDRELSGSC